jgi:serine/threonine protein phosphatase PrpC
MSRQLWFDFAAGSDRGPVRERNEDAAYADARVLALADGVGGQPGGDRASAAMVRGFAQIDLTLEGWDGADHLRAAAFRGEDAIAEQVALRPELDGMATARWGLAGISVPGPPSLSTKQGRYVRPVVGRCWGTLP